MIQSCFSGLALALLFLLPSHGNLCTPKSIPLSGFFTGVVPMRTHAIVRDDIGGATPVQNIYAVEYATGNSVLDATGENGNSFIASSPERYAYKNATGTFSRAPRLDSTQVKLEGINPTTSLDPFGAQVFGPYLVFWDLNGNGIFSAKMDGSSPAVRISGTAQTTRSLFGTVSVASSDSSVFAYYYQGQLYITRLDMGGPVSVSAGTNVLNSASVLFGAGNRLLFAEETGGNVDVYTVNADGTNRLRVALFQTGLDSFRSGTWTLNGNHIAVQVQRIGNGQVATWGADSQASSSHFVVHDFTSANVGAPLFPVGNSGLIFMQSDTLFGVNLAAGAGSLVTLSTVPVKLFSPIGATGAVTFNTTGGGAWYHSYNGISSTSLMLSTGSFNVDDAVQVPPGDNSVVLRNASGTLMLMNFVSNSVVETLTRPGDTPFFFLFQPTVSVSLIYFGNNAQGRNVLVASCLKQELAVDSAALPTLAPGHVFLSGQINASSTPVTFAGSAVFTAGTVVGVPCLEGQNITVIGSANWIEGSPTQIVVEGCPSGCAPGAVAAQTPLSLSVTVGSCAGGGGLPRTTIIAIAVSIGGAAVIFAVVILIVWRLRDRKADRDMQRHIERTQNA